MKLTTLAVASAFALCSTSVFGQSAGSTAGGNSKAGGPDIDHNRCGKQRKHDRRIA
jgi:hypothetical protein